MDRPADPVELAEREVAARKAVMRSDYDALQEKMRRQASSPKLIIGVLISAIVIAYFAIAGRGKPKRVVVEKGGGLWSQLLQTAQVLVPLAGVFKTVQATKAAESAKKTVSKATGTPPVPHDTGSEHA
jgi:hypothetical protein